MFKPHYGICVCHGLKRLIVVKKGYCHEGNEKYKSDRRRPCGDVGIGKDDDGVNTGVAGNSHGIRKNRNASFNPKRARKPKGVSKKNDKGKHNVNDYAKPRSVTTELVVSGRFFRDKGAAGKKNGMDVFSPKKKKPKKRKALQYRRKPTGESAIFKEIGEERGPYSQIYPHEWIDLNDVRCYSHILTKQAYPSYRKDKRNIILKTPAQHALWETQRHKLKDLPEWQWIFELEQTLKREYYEKSAITKK